MSTSTKSDARLNFRLPAAVKETIEEAAALSGQSVNDFAVSVLAQHARSLIQDHEHTLLSNRDRQVFLEMLDQADARPNKALAAAAKQYKKRFR